MSASPPPSPVPVADTVERRLEQFEKAWEGGQAPLIDDYLPAAAGLGPEHPAYRELLGELVKIDMEYRWRVGLPLSAAGPGRVPIAVAFGARRVRTRPAAAGPCLEKYLERFPVLGQGKPLLLELIAEEYRVRCCWGDRPRHEEYATRFTHLASQLPETLGRADAELAAEFARARELLEPECKGPVPGEAVRPPISVTDLVGVIQQNGLIPPEQMTELGRTHCGDARALAKELLAQGWLTPYQVNQLLRGRGADLVIGKYVLLERLGEGGAGQVFKARHQVMQRDAALKLIRQELLTDAEVIGRFDREIHIVSQLDHPNVVHAYDAGPVGTTHFLAMEFVEGTDLGRLVKQGGPLPVLQACEYIRQAALGLQHAHERGLVHRDIKPHNLIMSLREGRIKVADLGLARLQRSVSEEATAALTGEVRTTGTLTPENAVLMGTADYLAPEQALDFHKADIRADIYSLGCTFYYLLTGQAPFAGGTMAEKLLKHQQAAPRAVHQFRHDALPELTPILAKMMAKQPGNRYQTPRDVVDALATVLRSGGLPTDPSAARAGAAVSRRAWLVRLGRRRLLLGTAGALLATAVPLGIVFFKPEEDARSRAWRVLVTRWNDARTLPHELRRDLLAFRLAHPDAPEFLKAGELLMQLPSPLDDLDASKIPPDKRFPGQPADLVAVLECNNRVWSMAFSPDGRLLCGAGTMVRLWNFARSEPQSDEVAADGWGVYALAVSSDGKTMASGGESRTIRMWDISGLKPVAGDVLQGHTDRIDGLALAPGGRMLASRSRDTTIRLWDKDAPSPWKHRGVIHSPLEPGPVVFSPTGQTVAAAVGSVIRLYDLSGAQPAMTDEQKIPVGLLAFSPSGKVLASSGRDGEGTLVRLWDVDGTKLKSGPTLRHAGLRPIGLVFTLDGHTLVSSSGRSYDCHLAVWDLGPQGKPQMRPVIYIRDGMGESPLALADDGRHLAIARGTTVLILRLAPTPTGPRRVLRP